VNEEIRIEIPGRPVPWSVNIGRRGGYGVLLTPERLRDWQEFATLMATRAMRGRKPFTGPVSLSFTVIFGIPKGWNKATKKAAAEGRIFYAVVPDLTNLLKATEDCFTKAGVWNDDCQVVYQETLKRYGETPMVSVIVRPIEEVAG